MRGLVVSMVAAASLTFAGPAARSAELQDCPECPVMVVVPAGDFVMGSPANEVGGDQFGQPRHAVTIGKPFALGRYEVTRGEFAAFVAATAYQAGSSCWVNVDPNNREDKPGMGWANPGFAQTDRDPVVCMSWDDANAYVAWLSRKTGHDYRLPSEAEWEYAARAGTTTARYWGEAADNQACAFANVHDATSKRINGFSWETYPCDDGRARTAPGGSGKPNSFGLYDMIGNAWEWVADCWHDNYAGAPDDGRAWSDDKCSRRVIRGGGWNSEPSMSRSATRTQAAPGDRADDIGFRIAETLSP